MKDHAERQHVLDLGLLRDAVPRDPREREAFADMLETLKGGESRWLTPAQRRWVESRCPYRRGRGRDVALAELTKLSAETPAVLRNLPLHPPGRRPRP